MNPRSSELFRQQALDHYASAGQATGAALRLSPTWTRRTYWLLLVLVLGGLLYICIGKMPEYAEGTAVVWIQTTRVTARAPGTIQSVDVQQGQLVERDQVLVHFYDAPELAEFERSKQLFELQLVNSLCNPLDRAVRQDLTNLRAQRELARTMLNERCLKAEQAGVVGDLRLHAGQSFSAGDVLLSLTAPPAASSQEAKATRNTGPELRAILPAQYISLLQHEKKENLELRLELYGYRYAYTKAQIVYIGQEVLGPAAIRRELGQEIADSVPIQGPVLLVNAILPSTDFWSDNKQYKYYHGMQGKATIRVRSEPIIYTLIPWLKEARERWQDWKRSPA